MGRTRKPVSEQTKHLTVSERQQREFEEQLATASRSDLEAPPDWLIDDVAKNEWKRIIRELKPLDMIGNLDIDNIGGFCNAFACYVKATAQMSGKELVVITNGGCEENPLINIQRKYAKEMRDFARLCGLTIDSRLKLASAKAREIDDAIEEDFGDI